MNLPVVILALVTLERLGELWLSHRNTKRLLAQGGHEVGAGHYPLIFAVHVLWLATLWWLAPELSVDGFFLGLYVLLQVARFWTIEALGDRWTTRIIVLPNAPLVKRGPYRFTDHPNYVVVAGEIAVLPMVFGLWQAALIFTVLNAAVLWVRIREENRALGR